MKTKVTIQPDIDKVIKLPKRPIPDIKIRKKPNRELLLYILDVIKLNPDHHNQRAWRCNTSFCFAGFTDLIAAIYLNQKVDLKTASFHEMEEDALTNNKKWFKIISKEEDISLDEADSVEYLAKHLLGLNQSDADMLFRDSQDLSDIKDSIYKILG
jgi:hypothetical protein